MTQDHASLWLRLKDRGLLEPLMGVCHIFFCSAPGLQHFVKGFVCHSHRKAHTAPHSCTSQLWFGAMGVFRLTRWPQKKDPMSKDTVFGLKLFEKKKNTMADASDKTANSTGASIICIWQICQEGELHGMWHTRTQPRHQKSTSAFE